MSDDENDQSDEDVAYHELFENAQKAIHSSEANQRRSKAVREELEAYIDRTSEMKGSDGSTLIRKPSNFETIVNSMNRDDLSAETSKEKPWSQYLLLDGLNAEDDKEYNGRYARSFRDTPDVKIKRGLAQIQLLDRQLQEITRATHAENETGSPRADETFITTKHAQSTGELSPAAKKEVQRGHLGAQSKKTTNKYNIEKDQEQQRLAYLLSIEPGDEKGVESYWDPDLQAANEAIDERLAAFGRWGRGSKTTATTTAEADNIDPAGDADRAEAPAAEITFNEATTGDGGGNNKRERKVDYLHELRAVRLENERMQRLDALIDTCSNHPIEYEALLPKAPPVTSQKQNPASSYKGSPRAASSPLGTGRRSIITSSSSGSKVAGDVLAVPDPAEVLGSNSSSGSAVAEQLPPIPPLSSHTTVSEEGIRILPEHLIQSSKSQSAALATDYEDSISPRAAAASPRPVGATSAVKKSLRLPRGLLNAQLTATNAFDTAEAGAGADHPRPGLTVFRSINSELERQQLQQHAANGARLVKKIGAVLAAERDTTTTHHHHNNRHMHHHHHHQRQKDQQQQQSGESAEHLSPSSARRALKARNVLDSMTTSSSTASSATTTIIPSSSSRTNPPLSSPSGTIATSTTRDAAYGDVMRI
eukprot:gene10262-12014_t